MPSSHCMIFKVIGSPLFSHCTTIWGSSQSQLCSHCTMDWWQEVTRCMTLQQEESQTTLSGPQTTFHHQMHVRSDKEITQDHADIVVSSPIKRNKDDFLVNKYFCWEKCIYTRDVHLYNWGRYNLHLDAIHWRYTRSSLRYDSPLLRCSAIRFRYNAIRRNGKNMIVFIYLVQTDSKS